MGLSEWWANAGKVRCWFRGLVRDGDQVFAKVDIKGGWLDQKESYELTESQILAKLVHWKLTPAGRAALEEALIALQVEGPVDQ